MLQRHIVRGASRARAFSSGAYDAGRLNLPFVGHATFNKAAPVDPSVWEQQLEETKPDVAVIGAPFDCGTQYRAGARFGPRAIRAASTLYSFGHGAVYDHEDDYEYTYGKMLDLGVSMHVAARTPFLVSPSARTCGSTHTVSPVSTGRDSFSR
jgi:hypothetical protein